MRHDHRRTDPDWPSALRGVRAGRDLWGYAVSRPVDVLAVMDRQLRNRAERANRYTNAAEKAARRAGRPQITADRMAAYESLLLSELMEARAAMSELIEASHEYFVGYCVDEADDDCSGGNGFDTGCTPDQHRAANRLRRALKGVSPTQ